ncbi:MAG TPA: phosphoglycerate mutase family protein [Acidimicrobiales bacterium]
MAVLLVRHAKAGHRDRWAGDDRLRPLTPRGKDQAEALADLLVPYQPALLLSSPFVRCVQTVEPLAAALGVPVEEDGALAEGQAAAAVQLAARLAGSSVAVCSHGDVIPAMLDALARAAGIRLPPGPACAKGSVWVVEGSGTRAAMARYLPAPSRSS